MFCLTLNDFWFDLFTIFDNLEVCLYYQFIINVLCLSAVYVLLVITIFMTIFTTMFFKTLVIALRYFPQHEVQTVL
jgi:hypothetical protein